MDKRQEGNRNQRVVKILFWLGFLTFFAYSFWTTLDFGDLSHPRRQEAFFAY
jgi:hypothetical protein